MDESTLVYRGDTVISEGVYICHMIWYDTNLETHLFNSDIAGQMNSHSVATVPPGYLTVFRYEDNCPNSAI